MRSQTITTSVHQQLILPYLEHDANQWVTDTGATHHLTADMRNLMIPHEYNGTEQVHVGNGNTLEISNVGQAHGDNAAERAQ